MSKKNLQSKLEELQQIVNEFDDPAIAIETAIKRFDDAAKLAEEIEADLASLTTKITVLKKRFDSDS